MTIEQSEQYGCSLRAPLPSLTQYEISNRTLLREQGVSDADIDIYVDRYNRSSVPVIQDEMFFNICLRIVKENQGKVVETELQREIEKQSSYIYERYETTKIDMMMTHRNFFTSDDDQQQFDAGIRTLTVYNYCALVGNCLPPLVESYLSHLY